MNPLTAERTGIGVEEYLEGELYSDVRHEYAAGEVYAMVGASDRHGLIAGNLFALIRPRARKAGCQLFIADMKVRLRLNDQDYFYYPDLVLSCEPDDRATYYRESPCLIIEVLSQATERIDRREKLFAYQAIPSLREYLLVSQERPRVEVFRRSNRWHREEHTSGSVRVECLDTQLPFENIYEDIGMAT